MNYDVIIIGAGPAGTCAAKKLAEDGYSVMIYEKRNEIGAPKRCGEGLDVKAEKLVGKIPSKCVAQKIKGARVYAPNGKFLEAVVTYGGYVLERKVFDKWLAAQAVNAGAHVQAGTNITSLIIENGFVCGVKGEFIGDKFEANAKMVIFAGGSDSPLPKQAGLNVTCNPKLIDTCLQYEMAGVKSDQNFIHIYMGNKIAPRGYAWIFPKGNGTANVGLGVVPGSAQTPKYYLDLFLKENKELEGASIIEVNAGGVPVGGLLKEMATDGMIVCGEAAHHVNPIHGGGIKEAIVSGQLAAEIAIKAIKKNDVSRKVLTEFNDRWWKERGDHLAKVEKIREIMENLSDDDYNMLADTFKPEDIIEFTRGAKLNVFAKALMKNPKLVTLVRHLI